MSTNLGVALLDVDSRRSEDAAVEGCFMADRNSISASAVAAAASQSPELGRYSSESESVDGFSSVDEQPTAFQTESAAASPQHSHSSFSMKLRHKSNK